MANKNQEWKPDICIYHDPCDDGFAAAWVVWKKWGDTVDFRPTNYGRTVPDYDIADKKILIVDFSFNAETLEEMGERADSIIVLDHHKTAQAALVGFQEGAHLNILAEFDMHRSGARMTWDYCFPEQEVPELIRIIEDRDLWLFKIPETKPMSLYIRSYPRDFKTWDGIISRYDDAPIEVLAEAEAIQRFYDLKVWEIMKTATRRSIGSFNDIPTAHAPYAFVSDVGHALLEEHPDAPFAAIIIDSKGGRTYSLRSRDDLEDVSVIAQSFGGGGHRNAAGFRVPV